MTLSVMMITYSYEGFIAQTIASILARKTDREYESAAGGDCSTDGTRAIVANLSRPYPNRIPPLPKERNLGGPRNVQDTPAACRDQYLASKAMTIGPTRISCKDRWTFPDFTDWAIRCSHARAKKIRHELLLASGQTDGHRLLPGLVAYALFGSWYKVFSRAKSANGG